MKWYYYLHTNGDLIGKNPFVVESDPNYFNSNFVKTFWLIDTTERADCWKLLLEALALGANVNRVKELAEKWDATYIDSIDMLNRCEPTDLMKDGLKLFIPLVFDITEDDY